MAAKSIPDDRTIYTTFADIFKGQNALFRRPGPVQKLVQKHNKKPEVAKLLGEYGEPAVLDKLRILLAEGVFESTLNAKKRFPELFEVSLAQSAERAASEEAAAAQQAQTLEEAVDEALDDEVGSCGGDSGIGNEELLVDPQVSKPRERDVAETENPAAALQVPSLFPMYLPFATGHRILTKTQFILEAACFRFALETIPEVLAKRGWDCAEATELNVIIRQLLNHKTSLQKLEAAAGPDLGMLTRSMTKLRHATVHRGRLTAKVLEQFLADAETFATKLDDKEAISALSRSRGGVQKNIVEMENNKSMLETKLRKTLDDIAAQRAELDRLEKAAVVDVQRADAEYQSYIGTHLEQSLEQADDESDVGGASDDGPGLSEGSVSGNGDIDDLRDGCETEGEDECFEDAQEHESGVYLHWSPFALRNVMFTLPKSGGMP